MKKLLLLLIISVISCNNSKEHNGFPVIKAKTPYTEFKVAENWYKGWWSVAPQVEHDTLKITCFAPSEKFVFKTDSDSIKFTITPGKSKDFYIHLNDSVFAHTIITGVSFNPETIQHTTNRNDSINIRYQEGSSNDYLSELATKYPIKHLLKDESNDTDKILSILNWTNNRWSHNGNNSPSKSDAITILNEAKEGKQFPCFAYAIVLKAQLENAGYKARTLYLKTKDVETRKSSPGHVATEVFVPDLNKWIFIDGQFNIMPTLNNMPLNAVEFQDALSNNYDKLKLNSLDEVSKRLYTEFVYDYLYYLDTSLDHSVRIGTNNKRHTINNNYNIMLVPNGAKNPTKIDFWKMTLDGYLYTNSLADFYAKPI
ncbi:hypothetical protein WH52_03010 [Tenacibaculum holothuriorum]|uniref:Transglutaminase-like domain-containing protein n=1 Tax=Tenacibaculum holothuriorum TaxID=1635173 RepID=A0A1Y2PDX4_9FLAO|nr:transglutaminase domain-containing protein [Tenacibaculum holothuriorum]OSY88662.1 hypothetical protein WH52_03010 [Tenacibaculum holothuriorum]